MAVVSDHTALLTDNTWSGTSLGTPSVVTYSFSTQPQSYLAGEYTQAFIQSFEEFSSQDKYLTRTALGQFSSATGLFFIEVAPGTGDMQFGRLNFDLEAEYAPFSGFAYYPSQGINHTWSYHSDIGGDVFIDTQSANSLYLMLHEIGHAVGMKHPFDGDPTLLSSLDDRSNTVMSYTGARADVLGYLDYDALDVLYGPRIVVAGLLESVHFDTSTNTLRQVWGDAGSKIHGSVVDDSIDGGGGGDSIAGHSGNDILLGGAAADTLFGGAGNDSLIGGPGADVLYGGEWWGDTEGGIDTVLYTDASNPVTIQLDFRWDPTLGRWIDPFGDGSDVGRDSLYDIENAVGGAGHDSLIGSAGTNVLSGADGNDTIDGQAGNDTLLGDSGNDTLVGSAGDDVVDGGENVDLLVLSGSITDYQFSHVDGQLRIQDQRAGNDGTDHAFGVEKIQFSGGATHKVIDLLPDAQTQDIDGGTIDDVLWRNVNNGTVYTWKMEGTSPVASFIGGVGSAFDIEGLADIDGGGVADIVWRTTSGSVFAWKMETGAPVADFIGHSSTVFQIAGIGDIDGGGVGDIIWRKTDTGGVFSWSMEGGFATPRFVGGIGLSFEIAGLGDFDGGGVDDILFRHTGNGSVFLWSMETGSPVASFVGSVGTAFEILGVGDFDGSGTQDILWQNTNGDALSIWSMENGSPNVRSIGNPGPWIEIHGIGDFNGGGVDDLLMRDVNADSVYVWSMEGANPTPVYIGASSLTFQIENMDYDSLVF